MMKFYVFIIFSCVLICAQPVLADINPERLAYFKQAESQKTARISRDITDVSGKKRQHCTKNGYTSAVENIFEDHYSVNDRDVSIAAVECRAAGKNLQTGGTNGLSGSHMQLSVKVDGVKKYTVNDFPAGEFFIHDDHLFIVEQECCGGAKHYSTYDLVTGQPVERYIKIGARSHE